VRSSTFQSGFAPGSKIILALWVGSAVLALTACGKKGPPAPPAVEVSTVTVKPQAATVGTDYVAQTEAVNTVEIRPRVGGVLEKQVPIEGERLKVGEVLFVIDQQPYIAALAQAQAALAQSQAALIQSQRDLGRAKSLSEIDAVSQQETVPASRPRGKRETTDLGEPRAESFGKTRRSRRQCGTSFPPFAVLGFKVGVTTASKDRRHHVRPPERVERNMRAGSAIATGT
jgi:predicted small lipoprotein YifL